VGKPSKSEGWPIIAAASGGSLFSQDILTTVGKPTQKAIMKSLGLKHINRFLDSAQIVQENTGIDFLEDNEDDNAETKEYKAILRHYSEKRKRRETK
jgi:hypothetical protein